MVSTVREGINWENLSTLESRVIDCGHCGVRAASSLGWVGDWWIENSSQATMHTYICSHCNQPLYFGFKGQIPGPILVRQVEHVPDGVRQLFREAARCLAGNAPNGTVLICRKVLMAVATDLGAPDGENFAYYVDWLEQEHHIPSRGRVWVDRIREIGNEAAHELPDVQQEQAEQAIKFTEGLLTLVYEFPGNAAPPEPEEG